MSQLRESLRSRPSTAKKRTYNYTSSNDYHQLMALPSTKQAPSPSTLHDFSFEHKPNRNLPTPSSPQRKYQPSPPKNHTRIQVDEKISHIDNLNGKIASLLGSVKRGNQQKQHSPSRTQLPLSTTYGKDIHTTAKRVRFGEEAQTDSLYSANKTQRTPIQSDFKPRSSYLKDTNPLQPSKQPTVQVSPPIVSDLHSKPIHRSRVIEDYNEERKKRDEKYRQQQYSQLQKKDKAITTNAELDLKINQIRTKVIDQSPTKLKENQYPKTPIRETISGGSTLQIKAVNQVQRLAIKLSKLIDIDCTLRDVRESFANDTHSDKWQKLQAELKARNIYLSEADLKKQVPLAPLERNPFQQIVAVFPLNGAKDLAKLWGQAEWTWLQVQRSTDLDQLEACQFQFQSMDLNRKGSINIEDIACFVNVNAGKFYRSRDLVQLYKRLSQEENLTKGEGISYRGLQLKLCK